MATLRRSAHMLCTVLLAAAACFSSGAWAISDRLCSGMSGEVWVSLGSTGNIFWPMLRYELIYQCQGFATVDQQGTQLDGCLNSGTVCGYPAADAWCRFIGYDGLECDSCYDVVNATGPTRSMTGEFCLSAGNYSSYSNLTTYLADASAAKGPFCTTLKNIACTRNSESLQKSLLDIASTNNGGQYVTKGGRTFGAPAPGPGYINPLAPGYDIRASSTAAPGSSANSRAAVPTLAASGTWASWACGYDGACAFNGVCNPLPNPTCPTANCSAMQGNLAGDVIVLDVNSMVYGSTANRPPPITSPAACCNACKYTPGCNTWVFCGADGGCDPGRCDAATYGHNPANLTDTRRFGQFGGCVPNSNAFPKFMCSLKNQRGAMQAYEMGPQSSWVSGSTRAASGGPVMAPVLAPARASPQAPSTAVASGDSQPWLCQVEGPCSQPSKYPASVCATPPAPKCPTASCGARQGKVAGGQVTVLDFNSLQYSGGPNHPITITSAAACCELCRNNPNCDAWSFCPADGGCQAGSCDANSLRWNPLRMTDTTLFGQFGGCTENGAFPKFMCMLVKNASGSPAAISTSKAGESSWTSGIVSRSS